MAGSVCDGDGKETALPEIVPVILCGGSGTRLWPLSRETYPKPFIRRENGRTLFKDTLERASLFGSRRRPFVICNEDHRFYVLDSLSEAGAAADIVLEAAPRNTAPAIALAAFAALEQGDCLLLVMPSDHSLPDTEAFRQAVNEAASVASGHIVTFGIEPDKPETGYGYIECGNPLSGECHMVRRFVEKPDAASARQMLDSGSFFWNSGIFLVRASLYLRELERFAPQIHAACKDAWNDRSNDPPFIRPSAENFLAAPEDSIDYAIMERTRAAAMMPLRTSWSDLGSWDAIYQAAEADENGNVCHGDILSEDAANCYLHAEDRMIAAVGLRDLIVVESRDAVLIMPRNRSEDVKKIVRRLKDDKREQFRIHPVVHRPWGTYECLSSGSRFQVKRIIVKPGGALSLQLHHHRSEHWIVVHGTAEITVGEDARLFTENQSVYIPLGTTHKLRNPGIIPLELIEVQSGSYLGEDDIVRIEDSYGRK